MLTPVTLVDPGLALPRGEWFSERCEVPPGSMATTRHVQFAADNRTWEAYQHYFADPACRELMFTVYARGHLVLGPALGDLRGTRALDLSLTYAKVTAHDERVIGVLGGGQGQGQRQTCGLRPWKVGYEQDVTMTDGCAVLGLRVPHTERQVARVERHEHQLLLFMGQIPTPTGDGGFTLRAASPRGHGDVRPTSFAPPLVKCGNTLTSAHDVIGASPASASSAHLNQQQYGFYRSRSSSHRMTSSASVLFGVQVLLLAGMTIKLLCV